ncbi:MAG: lysophospholipid acyltransferase family protein [Halioglobus sp.]
MIKTLSRLILSLFGWRTSHTIAHMDKCVLIGAPHTTNWDFPLTLLGLSSMGVKFNWVAKHTLFVWPVGVVLRAIGGISVDRSQGATFLQEIVALYASKDRLVLAIAPEGTRSRAPHWKAGFYTIARNAGVPIGLGYIDYARKMIGIEQVLLPSGDIEQDMGIIREFYRHRVGKRPENQGEIRIKDRSTDVSNPET